MRHQWRRRIRLLERAAEAKKLVRRKLLLPDSLLEEVRRQGVPITGDSETMLLERHVRRKGLPRNT
jgi:hypothetical protein